MVLLRKHFRRREQCRLATCVHHGEHGPQRDQRLAGTHFTLQEAVHRVRACELPREHLADLDLTCGESERQARLEFVPQPTGRCHPRNGRQCSSRKPSLRQHCLQDEGLVPSEPFPCCSDVITTLRSMHGEQGAAQVRKGMA